MNEPTLFDFDLPQDLPGGFIVTQVDGKPIRPVLISDITARKHGGNAESRDANPSMDYKRDSHERILTILRERHATGKEIAEILHKPFYQITPRISELKALCKVESTGVRREGCAVLRIK